jgi:hypothetical protein
MNYIWQNGALDLDAEEGAGKGVITGEGGWEGGGEEAPSGARAKLAYRDSGIEKTEAKDLKWHKGEAG